MSTQCPDCNCGFNSPVNERTITLIVSNVLWALFFGISEFLGYSKKFKSHSLAEFLHSHLLAANGEDTNVGREESDDDRPVLPVRKRQAPHQSSSSEEREWQAYKDWRDLREYRHYMNDRSNISKLYAPRDTFADRDAHAYNNPKDLLDLPSGENRKRTPSNDGDVVEEVTVFKK